MKVDGLTTSAVYSSLTQAYEDQHKQIAQACKDIDSERAEIDTEYRAYSTKIVAPPSQEELNKKSDAYFKKFLGLYQLEIQARKLETNLLNGMNYLDRAPLNAETLETIGRNNPELRSTVEKDYETCMEYFNILKQEWGNIHNYRCRMEERLINLGTSYNYYKALVENGGMPLSYFRLALLKTAPQPFSPKSTPTPAQETTPSPTGMEEPIVVTVNVNTEEATGVEPEKKVQPETLEVKENSGTMREIDTATTTEPVVAGTTAVTENSEDVSVDGKVEHVNPQKKTQGIVDSPVGP